MVYATVFSFLWMFLFWVIYLVCRNPAIVDFAWTLCVYGIGILYFLQAKETSWISYFILSMTSIWALRLSFLILFRLAKEKQDPRYARLEKGWGKNIKRRYFFLFLTEGALALALTIPVYLVFQGVLASKALMFSGIAIALVGLLGVVISDLQLQIFRSLNKTGKKVCEKGFWRYSRHPNYFFEWIFWVGFSLLSAKGYIGMIGFVSPLVLFYILRFVTGVPTSEEQALKTKGDSYKLYQKVTSTFFPWFRKKSS